MSDDEVEFGNKMMRILCQPRASNISVEDQEKYLQFHSKKSYHNKLVELSITLDSGDFWRLWNFSENIVNVFKHSHSTVLRRQRGYRRVSRRWLHFCHLAGVI